MGQAQKQEFELGGVYAGNYAVLYQVDPGHEAVFAPTYKLKSPQPGMYIVKGKLMPLDDVSQRSLEKMLPPGSSRNEYAQLGKRFEDIDKARFYVTIVNEFSYLLESVSLAAEAGLTPERREVIEKTTTGWMTMLITQMLTDRGYDPQKAEEASRKAFSEERFDHIDALL
ncbi:MAG: hypothetical protein GXP63_02190 [DPANN group archaeon]|nr:hypothetical protein [DPANN group archaeon]